MVFWRMAGVVAVAWWMATLPGPTVAQGTCAARADMLTFARTILQDREGLNRFERRRIGAEAAYVLIHYGDLDAVEVDALLSALQREPMPDAQDLRATLTVTRHGTHAGLLTLDPDPLRAFAMAGPSARRALLLADGGQTYFTLLQEAADRPDLADLLPLRVAAGYDMPALVPDQSDAVLLSLSQTAEAAGVLVAAALLAADRSTLDAYEALIARHEGHDALTELEVMGRLHWYGATLRHGTGPVPRSDPVARQDRAEADKRFYEVMRAAYLDGPMQYGAAVMNQTGWEAEAAVVAQAFLDEVAAGRIDPVADPEAGWIFQYRAWAALKGRDGIQSVVGFFDFPSQRIRHYAGTALVSLDVMLAKEALRPFLQSEMVTLPTRPALLSDGFDWEMWVRVAEAIRDGDHGGLTAGDATMSVIAAELLSDQGRYAEAAELAGSGDEVFDRLVVLRDLMQRIDRQCDAIMAQPGQGLLLGGEFLFRF